MGKKRGRGSMRPSRTLLRQRAASSQYAILTVRIPPAWIRAMDLFAQRRSSVAGIWTRNHVLREALGIGLRQLLPTRDIMWPPDPKLLAKTVKKPRIDRTLQIDYLLGQLFDKHPSVTLADIRRVFNFRDRALVDAALLAHLQGGTLVLRQERTPGRSRAIYERAVAGVTVEGVPVEGALVESAKTIRKGLPDRYWNALGGGNKEEAERLKRSHEEK